MCAYLSVFMLKQDVHIVNDHCDLKGYLRGIWHDHFPGRNPKFFINF